MKVIAREELAKLFAETSDAHHEAYLDSNGVDPERASWYGPYLQVRLGDRLGRKVTRSELIYLLVKADREHGITAGDLPWPDYYAGVFLKG
jgi:hypothetical protein